MGWTKVGLAWVVLVVLVACQSPAASVPAGSLKPRMFSIGTNLGPLRDYGTELPFVDLMHSARVWFTKDAVSPPDWTLPWNTEATHLLSYRPDGYPTQVPQTVGGHSHPQKAATIWADATAWPEGTYTVLFNGTGTLALEGNFTALSKTSANRMTFVLVKPPGGAPSLQLILETSQAGDPVHNSRVLMPGAEATYQSQPFNPAWLAKLKMFSSVRFMDWGQTNSWGWELYPSRSPDASFTWSERQPVDRYTWADGRGVPYELMIQLMNQQGLDGWVCVPDRADPGFIRSMAGLFHETLSPGRILTVEYSNEVWNWGFPQAGFLNTYGHPGVYAIAQHRDHPTAFTYDPSVTWPEKITGNIQDCLDTWTEVYGADIGRLRRVVGLQTGWLDVSQRIAFNLRPGSFDAVAPGFYFALNQEGHDALDVLGTAATEADVDRVVRTVWETHDKAWMRSIKTGIADKLGIPMRFYEGGQHLTPTPFGVEPSYARALLDVQRSSAMKPNDEPLVLMNFSFVAPRSAQYGSWGLLETLDQNLGLVPAPKYEAVVEAQSW